MSIQWTIIAGFLYVELVLVLVLLLPFISPKSWQKVLKSKVAKGLESQSYIYFHVFIVLLLLFFVDAIREMRKYGNEIEDNKHDGHSHLDAEMQISMKLFRAQRNFYISGFALFLWLVLRRLITLISSQASLIANQEAAMKQALNASAEARKLMEEKQKRDDTFGESTDNQGNVLKEQEKEVKELRSKLLYTQEELQRAKSDLISMKTQAESVSKEYDRLMGEHAKLQNKIVGDQSRKDE